jgi:peptidoglycan/LPS O-acetylase OafA/YrhL
MRTQDVSEGADPPALGRFVALDGLRGLAALAVITDHVPSILLQTLLPGRTLAVDFFFVLSGFVLAPTPFVPPPLSATIFPLNGPAWSIFFELVANVAYAAMAPRLTRKTLIATIMAAAVLMALCTAVFNTMDMGWVWSAFIGGFPRVFYSFFAGVLIYRLHCRHPAPILPAGICAIGLLAVLACPSFGLPRPAVGCCLLFQPLCISALARGSPDSWLALRPPLAFCRTASTYCKRR